MSIDISGPAKGLCEVLNPGGSFNNSTKVRSGGTFVGSLANVQAYMPPVPYQGATPLLLVSSVPTTAQIEWDGAASHKMVGTLEAYYLARTVEETGLSLAQLDAQMADNLTSIVAAVLADKHLAGTVSGVTEPILVERDPRGLFLEWQGGAWVFGSLRIPFISLPSIP